MKVPAECAEMLNTYAKLEKNPTCDIKMEQEMKKAELSISNNDSKVRGGMQYALFKSLCKEYFFDYHMFCIPTCNIVVWNFRLNIVEYFCLIDRVYGY